MYIVYLVSCIYMNDPHCTNLGGSRKKSQDGGPDNVFFISFVFIQSSTHFIEQTEQNRNLFGLKQGLTCTSIFKEA